MTYLIYVLVVGLSISQGAIAKGDGFAWLVGGLIMWFAHIAYHFKD